MKPESAQTRLNQALDDINHEMKILASMGFRIKLQKTKAYVITQSGQTFYVPQIRVEAHES